VAEDEDFEFDELEEEERLRREARAALDLANAFKLVREHRAKLAALAKEGKSPGANTDQIGRVKQGSWPPFIIETIDELGRGLKVMELKELAEQSPVFKGHKVSHMAAAKAVKKLTDKGLIVHRGVRYYTPELLETLGPENLDPVMDRGAPSREGEHGIIVEAILALEALKEGMTSNEIIGALRMNRQVENRLSRGVGSIYNALRRLVQRGKLIKKDGARYMLATPQTNEAPDSSDAPSAQVNGSDPSPDGNLNPARPVH
jgi:hypothetical protein